MIDFVQWLDDELTDRGWSYSELARRASMSRGAISGVMTKRNKVTWEFCANVADAFGVSPILLFRKAELLQDEEGYESEKLENVAWEFCVKMADGLGITPVAMFKRIGLLRDDNDAGQLDELSELVSQLPPDKQAEVLNYVKFQVQNQE